MPDAVLRIGHLSTFYHTAILLMANEGLRNTLGIGIDWRLMPTGPEIMASFRRGEIDLAYVGLPPAIVGMDQGTDVICIAGGHMEGTVMAGRDTWKGLDQLPDRDAVLRQFIGRKIGVPGKGSIHDVILREWIDQAGLTNQIEVVNFRIADLVTEAVVKNEVSAAVGTPALAVSIRHYAGGKVLCPPSLLWPNNPSYGIVVRGEYLQRAGHVVEKFLRQHEGASKVLRSDPGCAARIIAGQVGIVGTEFVLETIAMSPNYCALLTNEYIDATMKFIPVMKNMGFIRSDLGVDRIFSTDLIRKVHPGPPHYRQHQVL